MLMYTKLESNTVVHLKGGHTDSQKMFDNVLFARQSFVQTIQRVGGGSQKKTCLGV